MRSIPLTVVAGPSGTGKSSLLRHLRRDSPDLRLGLIAQAGARVAPPLDVAWDALIWLPAAEELPHEGRSVAAAIRQVSRAALDHVILEADGEAHLEDFRALLPARTGFRPARIVAVLDPGTMKRLLSLEAPGTEKTHKSGLALNLMRQIEEADVIVLTRTAELEFSRFTAVLRFLGALNPAAGLAWSEGERVPPRLLLGDDGHETLDPSDERQPIGPAPLHYSRRRPFHPFRFQSFLRQRPGAFLRARGLVWLATRPDDYGVLFTAGPEWHLSHGGRFWAAMPDAEIPFDEGLLTELAAYWDPAWGDRRQDLLFFGIEMNPARLVAGLDSCLLTDAEMERGTEHWLALPDPFVPWDEEEPRPVLTGEPEFPLAS